MLARSDIENVLYWYAWAYDMDELNTIGDCFAEDAEVAFGTGVQYGREAVVAELTRRRGLYEKGTTPWHVISNVMIVEETDLEAVVTSFYTFFVKPAGEPAQFTSIGYYDDRFVNDKGIWRIQWRRVLGAGERAEDAPAAGTEPTA